MHHPHKSISCMIIIIPILISFQLLTDVYRAICFQLCIRCVQMCNSCVRMCACRSSVLLPHTSTSTTAATTPQLCHRSPYLPSPLPLRYISSTHAKWRSLHLSVSSTKVRATLTCSPATVLASTRRTGSSGVVLVAAELTRDGRHRSFVVPAWVRWL